MLSSAKKSAEQCLIDRGKSLIKIKNNVGPRIEPCGTPESVCENSDSPCSLLMAYTRELRYDVNQFRLAVLS